jgi:hypothetical protein
VLFAYVQLVPLLTTFGLGVTFDSLRLFCGWRTFRLAQPLSKTCLVAAIYLDLLFGIVFILGFLWIFISSNSEHRIPTASQRLRSGLKRGLL